MMPAAPVRIRWVAVWKLVAPPTITGTSRFAMKDLRFSGSPPRSTCSADTMVPWITSRSMPARITRCASSAAFCGDTRAATVDPPSLTAAIAAASRSSSIGAAYARCNAAVAASGSSESLATRTISSITASGSACRAHSPSALITPRPPARPTSIAIAGDATASDESMTNGIPKRYASICHAVETSADDRVRRDGTMAISARS